MREAHERGTPVMRTLFYQFPDDSQCWKIGTQYMYGDKYLCCPVLHENERKLKVYLPTVDNSEWFSLNENQEAPVGYEGGQWIEADAPLNWMPVFERRRL